MNRLSLSMVSCISYQSKFMFIMHSLGPPGTGKTTTIAAALHSWEREWSSAWVIAQSNVGVQNIADTLLKYAIDFKLLVSKEFYVEWCDRLLAIFQSLIC